MKLDRRQFAIGALGTLAAPFAPTLPALAEGTAPVYIGDMHAHLFFFGMGASPDKHPLAPAMASGKTTLASWSLVGDVPWLRITPRGLKQKGSPKHGEPMKWFEDDLARIKQHIDAQGLKLALTSDDVDRAVDGEPHVVITVEGATFVEDDDLAPLERAYELGVRSIQLVHYIENPLGDFQTEKPLHGGLTELGRAVVTECNRLGILVDLAHCTDVAVRQALEISTQPIIWSHSSVTRVRLPNWKMPVWQARQLSIASAERIAQSGGVVGLWPMRSDVGGSPAAYAQRLWELGEWLGEDHAGIGTDMNAISNAAIRSYADLQKVVRHWQNAGFPDRTIRKLAIGNYARVLKTAMEGRQA